MHHDPVSTIERLQMKRLFLLNVPLLLFSLFAFGFVARTAVAEPLVNITLDTAHPGPVIPSVFEGLSYETAQVLARPDGSHYFSPQNRPLIRMFRTLGVRCLRIGGNTADRPGVKIPDDHDIDSLFQFARAAGAKVIYTLRLRNGDPQADARIVHYITEHYPAQVLCFAIGNEPDFYEPDFPAYRDDWTRFMRTIVATTPIARFCGPSVGQRTAWSCDFAKDFAGNGQIAFVTQHYYPGGGGNKVTDPAAGRNKLLSRRLVSNYAHFYSLFAPVAIAHGLPYRLEEANNFYNGGAKDVSNTFTAALWGLGFLHWWAEHDANGVNFHTGDKVAAGAKTTVCQYAAFVTVPGGYEARPLAYGMKAFDLGDHGRLVPLTLSAAPDLNLTAYAVLGDNRVLCVTLINKNHSLDAQGVTVKLDPNQAVFRRGQVMYLTSPDHSVAATSGETLGGGKINRDGSWHGKWITLNQPKASHGTFVVELPAATSAIIKLTPLFKSRDDKN
jgi:hypothetical protein